MKIKLLESKQRKKLQLKSCFIALICFLSMNVIQAQTVTITGTVTGDGEPLAGASIIVKGTSRGAVTDFDGNYQLKSKSGEILQISYLGYLSQEITVGDQTTIDIVLEEDRASLEEVVVVGYGTQKKKEVTGAVGQIKNEELALSATADLGTALQGQIAGVNVTAQDGSPGAESTILIRGVNSIAANNAPLYVVDGIPQASDPKLSISEIETIDVLKDAASTAIYGVRGSGGVILITTKQGKVGVMKMTFDSYYGLQYITSGLPLIDTNEWLYVRHLNAAALNGTTWGNTWTPIVQGPHQLANNTNLTEVVENDTAPIQSHNISVSGGKQGLTYNVNGSFFGQEGMLRSSSYNRFNVRANTRYNKGKWTVNTGLGFRIEERERPPFQQLLQAYKYNPYSQQIDPDVTEVFHPGPDNNDGQNLSNNIIRFLHTDNDNVEQFNANITARYDFNKNFSYTARGGINYTNNTRVIVDPLFKAYDEDGELIPPNTRSGIRNESGRRYKSTFENIFNYKKSFGNHNVTLTAVYSAEKFEASSFFAQKKDLVSNEILELDGALNDADAGNGSVWNNNTQSLASFLGRVQYNYKGRYLLSALMRRDGSSQFGASNRYETFPSISLGWNVSDEGFWRGLKRTISSLKLRASHGTVGSDRFQPYSYAASIKVDEDYVFGSEGSDRLVKGAIQTAYANPNIQWETTISRNIGFDMGLFKNKLTLSAEFYDTEKENLLLPVLLPPTVGTGTNGTVVLNVGNMTNRGMEWTANYKHKGKFSWNAGATFTKNTNEITKMSGSNKIQYLDNSEVVQGVPNEDLVSVIAEGYEAGAFFLIKTDGIIKTQEELDAYNPLVGGNANLGDLRYVDANTVDTDGDGIADAGDGTINNDDRQYAGSGTPDWEAGFNFGANYKNFDFSMQWYASVGAEVMNGSKAFAYKSGTHKDLIYQWSPQNANSDIPTNRGRDHENFRGYTDFWLEDGTFARLRNVAIGYSIPKDVLEKHGFSKVRLYISAQNPLTITDYTGFDPEVGNNSIASKGLDRGSYPISSSFRLGVQFAF